MATQRLESAFPDHTTPKEFLTVSAAGRTHQVYFCQAVGASADSEIDFMTIGALEATPAMLAPSLHAILAELEPHLVAIPYLHIGENDFIYKFRPEKERNAAIYANDPTSSALYQSKLCELIKERARTHERSATSPMELNFGAATYLIPSHFGFCLGVKNAIERAYETLAANPCRRVFMLSELIHNPFVNDDLLRRGLTYLQTDKGVPFTVNGKSAVADPGAPLLWDSLTSEDIVIIPAFGATDNDKRKLVRKGIAVCQYDATCMLVEKVWKAARSYGRAGYTVIIHGKAEHEETKATFSNTRRYAPALIVRDLAETKLLSRVIRAKDPAVRSEFYSLFADKHTPGFDVNRDLERVAVVNQTTLLVNETRAIIAYLRDLYVDLHGPAAVERVGGGGRSDTLCYATQVNQDALAKALADPLDAAFVIGGKNSSNTYQLYRLCAQALGEKAFFIQSEANILSLNAVEHFVFPSMHAGRLTGQTEIRPLWSALTGPKRILITGGASCPDGLIQQVVSRLNALLPAENLRDIDAVIADFGPT
ncbi:MAG: 4-hydroxy-3-methylbut-2-enyl diphosphate reductase [Opitutaceae bacterium]|nr:4-hydroxy-3-methylbut-2-enyl diphosphate reductase [Opitutaceae bacterium]